MSGPSAISVQLPSEVREELRRRVRCGKTPQRDARRAHIALLAEEGVCNAEIARRIGCNVKTAQLWRDRIALFPSTDALLDIQRTGRPPRIPIEIHLELIKLACKRPEESKAGSTDKGKAESTDKGKVSSKAPFEQVWTLESLAEALVVETGVRMSRSEVFRILEGADLKPHRLRHWLHSPDPDFRPKVSAICALYLDPPEGATVLCIDEKPGMQALKQRFPLRPGTPGVLGRKEFEYKRNGTRTLIASYNTRTGEVLGRCGATRNAADLISFLEDIAKRYRTGPVYIIWDNLNIHHGPRWQEFNARHGGRFHFVYTPKHASWVNQIEVWFSILSRRVLRHASFGSVQQLTERVVGFIARWNHAEAHPFRWTFRGLWNTAPLPQAA